MNNEFWNPIGEGLPEKPKYDIEKLKSALKDLVAQNQKVFKSIYSNHYFNQIIYWFVVLVVILVISYFYNRGWDYMRVAIVSAVPLIFWYILVAIRKPSWPSGFMDVYETTLKAILIKDRDWRLDNNLENDPRSWRILLKKYSQIFDRGERERYLSEMVWGKWGYGLEKYRFWKGLLNYEVSYRDKEGDVYYDWDRVLILGTKLNKKICDGYIMLQGMRSDWWNEDLALLSNVKISHAIGNQMMDMESIEFNKAFYLIDSSRVKKDNWQKMFSPVVQNSLVNLWKWDNSISIFIQNDEMWFIFPAVSVWQPDLPNLKQNKSYLSNENYYEYYKVKIERLLNEIREIIDIWD